MGGIPWSMGVLSWVGWVSLEGPFTWEGYSQAAARFGFIFFFPIGIGVFGCRLRPKCLFGYAQNFFSVKNNPKIRGMAENRQKKAFFGVVIVQGKTGHSFPFATRETRL